MLLSVLASSAAQSPLEAEVVPRTTVGQKTGNKALDWFLDVDPFKDKVKSYQEFSQVNELLIKGNAFFSYFDVQGDRREILGGNATVCIGGKELSVKTTRYSRERQETFVLVDTYHWAVPGDKFTLGRCRNNAMTNLTAPTLDYVSYLAKEAAARAQYVLRDVKNHPVRQSWALSLSLSHRSQSRSPDMCGRPSPPESPPSANASGEDGRGDDACAARRGPRDQARRGGRRAGGEAMGEQAAGGRRRRARGARGGKAALGARVAADQGRAAPDRHGRGARQDGQGRQQEQALGRSVRAAQAGEGRG